MGYPVSYRAKARDYPKSRTGFQSSSGKSAPKPANDNLKPPKPANDNQKSLLEQMKPKLSEEQRKVFELGAKFLLRNNKYYKAFQRLKQLYELLEEPTLQFPGKLLRTDHAAGRTCGRPGDYYYASGLTNDTACGPVAAGVHLKTDSKIGQYASGQFGGVPHWRWTDYDVTTRPSDTRYWDIILVGGGHFPKTNTNPVEWTHAHHFEDRGEMHEHFPWATPWRMPINKPSPVPKPPPWFLAPHRENSPFHQTGPLPLARPRVRPKTDPWLVESDGKAGPTFEWVVQMRSNSRSPNRFFVGKTGRAIAKMPTSQLRRPPNKEEQEKKAFLALDKKSLGMRIVSLVTETGDVIEAIYDALPDEIKGKRKRSMTNQAKMIMEHWNEIPVNKAIENLLKNEFEDRVYGKIGKQLGKFARQQGLPHGLQMGKAL